MSFNPNISRRQLEESGEILREEETPIQDNSSVDQSSQWDSLKDVPFRGEKENVEEEEMSM